MAGYVELHAHSCWSLREGASTPEELLTQARALGYEALALTDHDNLYGAMEFARTAHDVGVRPITGCEVTMAPRVSGEAPSHLTLLVADAEGYRNLCQLLTRAYCTKGKDTPQVEWEWLVAHRKGLIVLSGCREGALARLLDPMRGEPRWHEARALAGELRDVFAERFFIELQHHDVYGDRQRVAALARAAAAVGVPLVATNNVHYHVRERHRLHDVLVAIRHRLTLDASHEVRRPNSEFFLKPPTAMMRRFAGYPEAVRNTVAIAERCVFDLTRDIPYRLPDYPVPEEATPDSVLRGICERAFARKYGGATPAIRAEARERLERELKLIAKHGLAGFFLVYWDILQLVGEIAHELHGRPRELPPDERPVGRGRGSSVSSIVCYLIGLSHIDPVTNELYLERFLNDELYSLPDIDLDFPRDIRDELLKRIYDRYGPEHAAMVAAFPTYRFRNAVRDIGKALGLPEALVTKLAKMGDAFASARQVEQEMRRIPELRPLADQPLWRDLIELAEQLAGFPRHISQHVGGVVISAEPLSRVVPLEPARMEGRFVCQWDKDSVDDARWVKIDFLALGMLSAVDECLDIIEDTHGVRVDLGRIPHDSPEVFAAIREGDTIGVFQIESRAQIQTLPRTQPRTLADLAVQVAIIRPGPILAGAFRPYMEYRERLARGEPVTIDYGHPELEPLVSWCLAETLGHVLYQDQVLQIATSVAGFTPGQADRLRRAMSRKRSAEAMQALAEEFFEGARRNGVREDAARVAFEKIAAFAAYGFPKSHAVAFALLAYESCWLRLHYPVAYYCALINAQPMGFYPVESLLEDARHHGIEVRMPAINASRACTWPEGDAIRLGLDRVAGLGSGWRRRGIRRKAGKSIVVGTLSPAERIEWERVSNGPYRSLYDVVTRARIDRAQAEALIRAGALDEFGLQRRELLWQLGLLTFGTTNRESTAFQPPLPLPTDQDMVALPELSQWQRLAWDWELVGTSPVGHPMALIRPLLHEGIVTSRHIGGVGNPNRLPQGMKVEYAGMVVTRQRPESAAGVMFMLLEDEFGWVNVVVHPQLQDAQRELVRATPFVIVRGHIDNERSGFPHIVAERFRPCPLPGRIAPPDSHDFG